MFIIPYKGFPRQTEALNSAICFLHLHHLIPAKVGLLLTPKAASG